jgi:hypothetical protein
VAVQAGGLGADSLESPALLSSTSCGALHCQVTGPSSERAQLQAIFWPTMLFCNALPFPLEWQLLEDGEFQLAVVFLECRTSQMGMLFPSFVCCASWTCQVFVIITCPGNSQQSVLEPGDETPLHAAAEGGALLAVRLVQNGMCCDVFHRCSLHAEFQKG